MLHWKLGSRWQSNACKYMAGSREPLLRLAKWLPASLPRDVDAVMDAVDLIGRFEIKGMRDSGALPMRTTLLHLRCPQVVRIFDEMMLRAGRVLAKNAKHDRAVLRQYLRWVWMLTDRYAKAFARFRFPEMPVRAVEMALWVIRDGR